MRKAHFYNEFLKSSRRSEVEDVLTVVKNRIVMMRPPKQSEFEYPKNSCECSAWGRMAPCSWCTSSALDDEDGQ